MNSSRSGDKIDKTREMVWVRNWGAKTCGIPRSKLGFPRKTAKTELKTEYTEMTVAGTIKMKWSRMKN